MAKNQNIPLHLPSIFVLFLLFSLVHYERIGSDQRLGVHRIFLRADWAGKHSSVDGGGICIWLGIFFIFFYLYPQRT